MENFNNAIQPPLSIVRVSLDLGTTKLSLDAFRSAIIQRIGFGNSDFFHNHETKGDTEQVKYRYPLVQYKWIEGYPSMICIGDAATEVYLLFSKAQKTLNLYQKEVPFRIQCLELKELHIEVADTQKFSYQVRHYLALNQANFGEYQKLETPWERFAFIEKMLTNHLAAFCKGVNRKPEKRFSLQITDFPDPKVIESNGHKVKVFDLRFKTDLLLPPYIGIGKDVAKGMGVVSVSSEQLSIVPSYRV